MSKASKISKPIKSKDVPVTEAMLYLVRDELKSHIISHESRFDSIDKRFESIDKRFDSFELRIESMFSKIDAKLDKMQAEIHRSNLIAEEQNSRNKFVMDGYTSVYYRCEENEKRINEVENDFQKLLKARNNEPMPK